MLIYKITNKINGKIYIGQTKLTMEKRWKGHLKAVKSGSKCHLHRAIRKYGLGSFSLEVLQDNISDRDELGRLEQEYISQYKSHIPDIGYNQTMGGDGVVPTDEMRAKISERMMGKYVGENNPFYGKHHSQYVKDLVGRIHRGKKLSEEEVRRRADSLIENGSNKGEKHWLYGKKWDEAHLETFRIKSSGENNSMYGKCGPDAPNYGKVRSEETRERQSDARRLFWDSKTPEERIKFIEERSKKSRESHMLKKVATALLVAC